MSFLNYVKFIVCLWELVGVSFLGSLGSCSGSLLRVFLTGLASFAAFVFYLFELLMKEWCCAVPGLESHDQHLAALILAGTLNFESLGSLVCVRLLPVSTLWVTRRPGRNLTHRGLPMPLCSQFSAGCVGTVIWP